MKDPKFSLKKGNPRTLGVTQEEKGYHFVLSVPEDKEVSLLLYQKGAPEPEQEIPLPGHYRTGSVSAVCISGIRPERYEYNYRIGNRIVWDPCAQVLRGLGSFGELPDLERPHTVRCGFFSQKFFSDAEEKLPEIPYEDTVIYKVHVRGYTMHKNSRVRRKGTFAGLREKIPYFQELGITALELMPAYEFQEVMIPKDMPLEYACKLGRPFPLNYWGYTQGYYFAPKSAYSYGPDPAREFRELVKALHRANMECIMEFYFPRTCSPLLVQSALRHWSLQYRVDGFHLVGEGVPGRLLAEDPLLSKTKLLFQSADGYGFGNLAEYNQGFQQDMRRWLKGDENCLRDALARMRRNPDTHAVVNYMANQDGFTLQDLVSFDKKHNEANQEDNQDGVSCNHSWNCGVEGPTRRKSVRMLRARQVKNAFLMLLFSQGVPLIYGGDEFGNSQQGNNNAYCQDNETGWIDWGRARYSQELTDFVKELIAFRKAHKVLHMAQEPKGTDYRSLGYPDISYHGQRAWYGDLDSLSRQIGILYCEGYGQEDSRTQDFLYLAYNLHWEPQRLALPHLPGKMQWAVVLKTCTAQEQKGPWFEEDYVLVPARTILVLAADKKTIL